MKPTRPFPLIILCCLLALAPARAEPAAPAATPIMPDAETLTEPPKALVFFGDSITHSGTYHQLVQLFLVTRYPGRDLWTLNNGSSGERAEGAIKRQLVAIDIAPESPDYAFVHFGMNDISRDADLYRRTMNTLVDQLLALKMKVIIMSPTPYDAEHTAYPRDDPPKRSPDKIREFREVGRQLAAERGLGWVDLYTTIQQINVEGQKTDPKFTLIRDRVHPNQGGHEVMFYNIIKSLGLRSEVYDVALKSDGTVEHASGASVEHAKAADGALEFTLKETALPFPSDNAHFDRIPFDAELNRMRLTVGGLAPGNHRLLIDGKPVGSWSESEWAAGIDLAKNKETPQAAAAARWKDTILEKKYEAQKAIANTRSLRYQIRVVNKFSDQPAAWINKDPGEFLAEGNARYDELVAAGKTPQSWQGYVFKEGREALKNWDTIQQQLTDIRREVASQPSSFAHTYRIEPETN